jgi:pyrroline-5-carboxylate reductase
MRSFEKIGIIGGGQMGEAIIRGLLQSGVVKPEQIMLAEPDAGRGRHIADTYSVVLAGEPSSLAAGCRILLLAVKPQVARRVLASYSAHLSGSHLLISIAAGISIRSLEEWAGSDMKIIRVMPNTPALVLAGAAALSPNSMATRDDVADAVSIFSAVGTCLEVEEHLLDAVTGLSGSGPGYVFAFIEAMIDGGVLAGLPREVAEKLVLQTVYGSARLALETGEPPAVLKGKVTSPGGTTITGLQVLEESGLRGAVMTAVEAAAERSKELGR